MRGHVRRRGSGWQLAVYVGVTTDGRRRYVYEAVRGTKRDAERRLAELISEVDSGRRSAPTSATLRELAEVWWETAASELSPTTRRGYRRLLDVRVLPALGAKRITRLTTQDLDRYYVELSDGRAPGGGALSARSVRHVHAVISGMLSTAVRWGWIALSPAERARLPRMATRRIVAPEPEQVARLLEVAAIDHEQFAMFLRLAVATGARRGELCGLRWTDVDLDAGEVRIHRSIAASDINSHSLVEKGTKTHQGRVIALDDGSVRGLRQEWRTMRVRALAVGVPYAPDAYLFSADPAGMRPWHPDAVTSTFRRIARKAEVTGVRLHDLRHYHGTMLADLGVPMPAVRDRLGHRDLQTTNLYAHGRRSADRSAADLIGDHLDDSSTSGRNDS